MKRTYIFLFMLTVTTAIFAQSEIPSDSISRMPTNYKEVGGFLLDMGLMAIMPPDLPKSDFKLPDASKDFNQIFRLNPQTTYTQGYSNVFSLSNGFWGMSGSSQFMQMGSFKLKNGWQINTYGDYNKDGYRVFNPSALPWEKNNFRGAFEMKSANGSFGIRIEVQQGRNGIYPY